MDFQLSELGKILSGESGIEQLMNDLGNALAEGADNICMLGGGNPASIPAVNEVWRQQMLRLLDQNPDRFDRMLVNYDPCRGNAEFLDAVADCFNRMYGWGLTRENVVVTNGGQTAFFYLVNLLSGNAQGRSKRILLPLVPEYIGYANQGLSKNAFRAAQPNIDFIDAKTFKYRVDFESLPLNDETAAICVSRPTNPTGNVLTDEEVNKLRELALAKGIPLIVDNAYGVPFPNIIFGDATPPWGENVVLTYSLSKLGLPGTRTGIVIGPKQITKAISSANAVGGLANGNVGQTLVTDLLRNQSLISLSKDVIRPYYQERSKDALSMLSELMPPDSYSVHVSEGSLFLWLWLKLPITTLEFYERLKQRGVLVVPGEYFFFGLEAPWQHQHECIRMTFSMPNEIVRRGIELIAKEVRSLV